MKRKETYLLVAFGVALYAGLMNLDKVWGALGWLGSLLTPILAGLLAAFVLSVPMNGFEKLLRRWLPKAKQALLDGLSLGLTLLVIAAVLALALRLAVPELARSLGSIASEVRTRWPQWARKLSDLGLDTRAVTDWFAANDWRTLLEKALTGAGSLIGGIVTVASSTVSVAVNAAFALVIMFYVLLGKRDLGRQCRKLLYATLRETAADRICAVAALTHDTYARFLSGQCVEVVILGSLIFAAFSVFRIPYAALTAVLTAVLAFIPYVGAFSSCAIGALLTLLAEPGKTILCIIVYQAVQFVENQFIYPHVVGGSVGLAPIWTLVAALLGGQLFGLVGIIFFIPLTAVIYQLIGQGTNRRLAAKGRSTADGGKPAPEDPPQETE